MGNRTPLYDTHVASGAKIVDFGLARVSATSPPTR